MDAVLFSVGGLAGESSTSIVEHVKKNFVNKLQWRRHDRKHALTNYKHDDHTISDALTSCVNKLLTGLTKLLVFSFFVFCILFETFSSKQEEAAWSDYLLIRSTFYPSACGQCKNTYSPRTLLSHWTKQTHKNPANNLLLRAVGKAHRPPSVDVGFNGFGPSRLRTRHTGNLPHDENSRLPLCALPVLTTNGFPLGLISP